jgi:hypothetical protein
MCFQVLIWRVMPNLPSEIVFASLLTYSTRATTADELRARNVMLDLKGGRRYTPELTVCQRVAQRLLEFKDLPEFLGLFGPDVLAIPIPSSSLKQPGSLWIPHDLALALKEVHLVEEVHTLVQRVSPLPKSAISRAEDRSKAIDHYNSVQVSKGLQLPDSILLVDDVITRGATMLGVAARVMEAFPGVPIFGFAAIRALSPPTEFKTLLAPCRGRIQLSGDHTFRRP